MHIDNTLRLDFKDVLIRPKRSTLISRSEVDITRDFKFLHAPVAYHGIPVIAANMDTTGTFEMAKALDPFMLSAALDNDAMQAMAANPQAFAAMSARTRMDVLSSIRRCWGHPRCFPWWMSPQQRWWENTRCPTPPALGP